jgi:K+-sensing histidine kinase KdpD
MGLLSIVVGLALMGAVADFVIENDIATAATQSFQIAGTTQQLSLPVLVAAAFALGALALGLILLGVRSMRRGRRRTLQQRIRTLEDENARLHAQRNLQRIVRIPESEPVAEANAATTAPPPPPTPAPEAQPPASKW